MLQGYLFSWAGLTGLKLLQHNDSYQQKEQFASARSRIIYYCQYYGHSLHIKAHFADNNKKYQGWNIICSPLSISTSHYLQIQQAEISFLAHHQGVNDIFTLESITVSSLYYTSCNDLHLYNDIILAIIIMFIYSSLIVIWDSWILICHPSMSFLPSAWYQAQIILSGGKSKSIGLKWQQCPQNEHHCYINNQHNVSY